MGDKMAENEMVNLGESKSFELIQKITDKDYCILDKNIKEHNSPNEYPRLIKIHTPKHISINIKTESRTTNIKDILNSLFSPDQLDSIEEFIENLDDKVKYGITDNSKKNEKYKIITTKNGTTYYENNNTNTGTNKNAKIRCAFEIIREFINSNYNTKSLSLKDFTFEIDVVRSSYYNKVLREVGIMKTTIEKIDDLVKKSKKQIVLTGPPGTGKTFDAIKYAKENGYFEFIQFHSSYDYTDFVEGIRPVSDNNDGMKFVKLDGIFKEFCRNVVEKNKTEDEKIPKDSVSSKNYFFIIDEINRADLGKVFGELMYGLEETYRGEIIKTQYHNLPTYKVDKDGKASTITEDVFSEGFYIPKNVIIIGTMNDIDRSVESFDFALRRRFHWVNIEANEVMDYKLREMRDVDKNVEDYIAVANRLNEYIIEKGTQFGLNEAFLLGPSYFKSGDFDDIWEYCVKPILTEYCRSYGSKETNEFIGECGRFFGKSDLPANKE